jgi:hypothetical protein
VAASETNINYSTLHIMRSKSISDAMPKVMMCSMMDPIHIHELPRSECLCMYRYEQYKFS